MTPSIKQVVSESHTISNNGEWATITMVDYGVTGHNEYTKTYSGSILCHTSYGEFNYSWSHLSIPFTEFLCTVRMNYFLQKTMGDKFEVIDSLATSNGIAKFLHENDLEFNLEDLWFLSVDDFCDWFYCISNDAHDCLYDNHWSDYIVMQVNPQGTGFWNDLWTPFIEHIKEHK